ncbi:MAG TPA: hypothetical protein VF458_20790 [Ktedonobacteraceae bacterium]
MDPTIVQYVLFILVALGIIGAVVALNRWLYRHSKPVDPGAPNTWTRFDTRRRDSREEVPANLFLDNDEEEEVELHARARQNGHNSNGHHPQN